MTVAILNDQAVVKGTITIPRFGVWTADLSVDHDEDLSGSLTLELGDGLQMIGAIERQEVIFASYNETKIRHFYAALFEWLEVGETPVELNGSRR